MNFFSDEIEKEKGKDTSQKEKLNFLSRLDIEEIKNKHEETELTKKQKSLAVLNGLSLNPILVQGREIHSEDRLLNKFKFVLKRARKNMCLGNEEIRHRDRVSLVQANM